MKKPSRNMVFCLFVCFFFCFILLSRVAYSIAPEDVPAPLKPWTQWVLEGENTIDCPWIYNNPEDRQCRWPSQLSLNLNDSQGQFQMRCRLFGTDRIRLPGNTDHWPQNVTINGKPAVVLTGRHTPGILLEAGSYDIKGEFSWNALPDAISIPPDTGIVFLNINGKSVTIPDVDASGRLWVKQKSRKTDDQVGLEDHISIQVFRRIIDEIPMEMVTRIDLKVSGKERDVMLNEILFNGFVPLGLSSPLPARIESGNSLRLTLRPGNWTLTLTSRSTKDITRVSLPDMPDPWPENEIWVFDARSHLRLVKVDGLESVDPRQTNVPGDWRSLPAFRAKPGDALKLTLIRRGDPEPAPDQLQLNRNLWLDFDGTGYTFQDHITGTMTQGWRLETGPDILLGQVVIDGEPQFITTLADSEKPGVEVRRGRLNLTADARYEKGMGSLPATGWEKDFQSVQAVLNLPPGWKLFAMGGVDNVPNTWLSRWTLMDLFLVLIIAISFFKLWSLRMGLMAILLVGLIWHEPNAPRYVWLHILGAIALVGVLPKGRIKFMAVYYRNIAFIVLILFAIPFIKDQILNGIYPQLEKSRYPVLSRHISDQVQSVQPEAPMMAGRKSKMPITTAMESIGSGAMDKELKATREIQQWAATGQIDPNALVQTGPGIPKWKWRSIPFSWNGPVKSGQRVKLVLLSPSVNLALNFLRVVLLLATALFLFKTALAEKSTGSGKALRNGTIVAVIATLLFIPQAMAANFPPPELLKNLKTKLLKPPDCFPECAQISKMSLNVTKDLITLRLEVHAGALVALPLPGNADQWLPTQVLVDGKQANGLFRSKEGAIWLNVYEGIHQVILSGPLPLRDMVQLSLSLKPHVVTVTSAGWIVKGIRENGIADSHLQLERIREKAEKVKAPSSEAQVLPSFAKIERILHLGLDWTVENRVSRISPGDTAIVLEIPLLPGESVTSSGVRTTNGKALVNMAPGQRFFTWQSALEKQSSLTLTAPKTDSWIEIWKADVATIWHTQFSGISAIHHQDQAGNWLPEWRPWPGESVTLITQRPKGITGQTLTIDSSRLEVTPGKRATDARLVFTVNSSQGGQHAIVLPERAELQSVLIDNRAQPVRQKGRQVTLPIKPGKQTFTLSLRDSDGIKSCFKTPDIDLNIPSVNHSATIRLGHDRWVLWASGPRLGPAVLFWGVLLVVLIVAVGLGRIPLTPLKARHWFLLGVGMSQAHVVSGLLVVSWLFALGARKNKTHDIDTASFNFIQIGLVGLTLIALSSLFFAVQKGLLGIPEMQILGNNSTPYILNWFADRVNGGLPTAGVLSVPLMVYRLLMLAWALWLAFSLVSWLRWGWQCFSENGLWQKVTLPKRKKKKKSEENIIEAESLKEKGQE